ncbi:protein of unknown function [Shewanella benthica]|uniref:Uncharacterized protein n=1 Tax=Shewanella benthica TaxID=43661 RepID=A0A330M173_9GAMM|nr:protein of unknown function [Shewanella benthica]
MPLLSATDVFYGNTPKSFGKWPTDKFYDHSLALGLITRR